MAEFDYPNGDLLVSAAWLAQHHNDPQVKIIDARNAKDYAEGHIPGAVLLPNGAFRQRGASPMPAPRRSSLPRPARWGYSPRTRWCATTAQEGHVPGGSLHASGTGMPAS